MQNIKINLLTSQIWEKSKILITAPVSSFGFSSQGFEIVGEQNCTLFEVTKYIYPSTIPGTVLKCYILLLLFDGFSYQLLITTFYCI